MARVRSASSSRWRTAWRVLLSGILLFAGISHLSVARKAFRAQVPEWLPLDPDTVVLASGVVEIALGGALVALPKRRSTVGLVTALFFVAIFPGNISQLTTRTNSFGLDTDAARGIRLLFQPLLVIWALWSTGVLGGDRRVGVDGGASNITESSKTANF